MIIEIKEKGSKEFYEEIVNASLQFNRIKKNPKLKLINCIKKYNFGFKLFIATSIVLLLCLILEFDYTGFLIFLFNIMFAFYFKIYSNAMKKQVNGLLNNDNKSKIIIDENGVELDKENTQKIMIKWNAIKYIIANKESITIYPDDNSNIILGVTIKYKEDVMEALNENNKINLFIDNENLYKKKKEKIK